MCIYKSFFDRGLALAVLWVALALLAGCGTEQERSGAGGPVFFPPAPERARLQFLKSFSGPEDLGVAGPSGFEKFVLGESEEKEGIETPYGLALFEGKLYICDVGKRRVEMLDLKNRSFGYLTEDRRMMNPVNIFIEDDGTKYVADPTAGAVFVFDRSNTLQAILGKELRLSPIDVVARGAYCYVTDFAGNQVVVLDKATGREIRRLGEKGEGENQFKLISDLTFGPEGDLYVTDKLAAKIFQFDPAGNLKRTVGRLGDNIDELVRPKGIALDTSGRLWVVDASSEVAKIYDQQGRLLLFFGLPGLEPGMMNLPAKIILDYEHVDLFRQYAVKGANLEFLVLVSNQYGPSKVNVYGFGEFPAPAGLGATASKSRAANEPQRSAIPPAARPVAAQTPQVEQRPESAGPVQRSQQEIADLYYRSMEWYRAGRLEEARAGFVEIVKSGLIPPPMEQTLRGYIKDIDGKLAGAPGARP
jgi:hypothetical protein